MQSQISTGWRAWAGMYLKCYFSIGLIFFFFMFVVFTPLIFVLGKCDCQSVGEALYESAIVGLHIGWITVALFVGIFVLNDLLGSKLDWLAIKEERIFRLNADLETAHERCLDSLKELGRPVAVIDSNGKLGEISARTAMTFRSFGEYVRFKLTAVAPSLIEVRVLSRPVMSPTTHDHGINAKNIEAVAGTLSSYERA